MSAFCSTAHMGHTRAMGGQDGEFYNIRESVKINYESI